MYFQYSQSVVFFLSSIFTVIHCTHFRGGMISWRIVDESSTPLVVEILQRYAWRYTFFSPYCTDATIPNGLPILGSSGDTLDCVSNCPAGLGTLGSVRVPCTGYNIDEQYAMGEGRFSINVPKNANFTAAFSSAAWFDLVTGNNLAWSIAVQVQTFIRSDTGHYNNAPIVTMLPIYRLRNGISYSLKINVADNDFDPYICMWSEGSTQCGGLVNSVPDGVVDNFNCYLNFTPQIAGFYAAALTVEDFLHQPTSIYSTDYLSQVPIQFVFHVYESPDPCVTGPIYIGDLVPDICLYMDVGDNLTTRVRFKIQCPNASITSYISANPAGLITTPILQDPFDPTIFAFLASFKANSDQIGQNLFCFAAVDSIGNQGDSACLRFTVSSKTSSLQPLYLANATRYPMGLVSKTTSIWTMLTLGRVYVRPSTETYIRFKRTSDNTDYYVLNAMTAVDNVRFLSDRIVINSTVTWASGEEFYIFFEAGVFVEASTCTKEAMPISDPKFWPFRTVFETTTTSTTSTTTTSITTTTTGRTTPTRRTLGTSTTTTTTSTSTTSTVSTQTTSFLVTTGRSISRLSISTIVGLSLACLFTCFLLTWIILKFIRVILIRYLLLESGLRQQFFSIHSDFTPNLNLNSTSTRTKNHLRASLVQYKLATRYRQRRSTAKYQILTNQNSFRENLVEVQI